jgi:hypothetical protein
VRVARTLRLPSHAHPRNPFLAAASFATLAPPDTPVSYLLPLHTVFSCSPGRLCPIDFIDKGCSLAAARAGRGSGRRRRAWQAAARRVRCFSHAASLSPRARRSPPPYLFLGLDHLQKETARIASHPTRILRLDRKNLPLHLSRQPPSLRSELASRLDGLSPPTVSLLRTLSVGGFQVGRSRS